MSEAHKEVVRRYFDALGAGDPDALDEIMHDDFVDHTGQSGPGGLDELKEFFVALRAAFPDFTVSVEELIAEGDLVAGRFAFQGSQTGELMGMPPSGRRAAIGGIDLFRVRDGRIAELWGYEDMLGLMQQIGAIE